jgi:hypothetical protein
MRLIIAIVLAAGVAGCLSDQERVARLGSN